MNTEIDNLTIDESIDAIEDLISRNKNAYVVTPNVDHIVKLEEGGELAEAYANADLILCDGMPLVWISRIYGTPIKEKVSGSDLFPRLCKRASEKGYSMFFLGAEEGVAAEAARRLCRKFKGLNVVGTYSPPVGFEKDPAEMNRIKDMICEAKPHILIVALGNPKQELFIARNRDTLGVPISLGLGASVDFEAGKVRRAPKWMADHGLEWVFRLMMDPKRLAKRYLIDDIRIFRLIIKYWKPKSKRR